MQISSPGCLIEPLQDRRTLEFVAFGWPRDVGENVSWPNAAGAALRDSDDKARLLHFAPGRLLAPDPSASTEALLDAAAARGLGTCIDATGKWEHYIVSGPSAARLLACGIEIGATLDARECAAITLFDCPAIIARSRDAFEVWVQASYAIDLLATLQGFRAVLHQRGEMR